MKRSKLFLLGSLLVAGIASTLVALESNALFRITVSEANLSRETFHEGEVSVTTVGLTNATKTLEMIQVLNGLAVQNTTQCAAIVRAAASYTFSNVNDTIYILTNAAYLNFVGVTNIGTILRSMNGVTVTNLSTITNLTTKGG